MREDYEMLAATLAHEMKSPLALVRANLDYIELCDTEKRYSKSCAVMKRQLARTDSMIQDFIGMLFVSGTNTEGKLCELREIITEAAADYATRPDLEVALALPAHMRTRGNDRLLKIVLSNAIKNAAEAGARRVSIRCEEDNARARITVTDDGTGLSPEVLEQIEEGGGFTTKQYGNGLGVVISRRITESLGGSYRIANAESGGCQVEICLPAASPELPRSGPAHAGGSP